MVVQHCLQLTVDISQWSNACSVKQRTSVWFSMFVRLCMRQEIRQPYQFGARYESTPIYHSNVNALVLVVRYGTHIILPSCAEWFSPPMIDIYIRHRVRWLTRRQPSLHSEPSSDIRAGLLRGILNTHNNKHDRHKGPWPTLWIGALVIGFCMHLPRRPDPDVSDLQISSEDWGKHSKCETSFENAITEKNWAWVRN